MLVTKDTRGGGSDNKSKYEVEISTIHPHSSYNPSQFILLGTSVHFQAGLNVFTFEYKRRHLSRVSIAVLSRASALARCHNDGYCRIYIDFGVVFLGTAALSGCRRVCINFIRTRSTIIHRACLGRIGVFLQMSTPVFNLCISPGTAAAALNGRRNGSGGSSGGLAVDQINFFRIG